MNDSTRTQKVENRTDLFRVPPEVTDIQKDITEASNKHNAFLKESGLPPLS